MTGELINTRLMMTLRTEVSSQSMGLGGKLLMTMHQVDTGNTVSLIAREKAPAVVSRDMFGDCSECSRRGGRSVTVPGEDVYTWPGKGARRTSGSPAIRSTWTTCLISSRSNTEPKTLEIS